MKAKDKLSRRQFLARSSGTAAALGAGSMLAGCSRPQESMTAAPAASARRRIGANDRICIGLIGSGGQGMHDAGEACRADHVVCGALCDVAEFRFADAAPRLTKIMEDEKGHQGVEIAHDSDYRRLLDRREIDAVIIATPDHWHYQPFLAALEAGKHVYQEKPMCYTIKQGLEMVAAAEKHRELTIQVGTHFRSSTHYPKAKQLIDDGVLGEIKYVRACDTRNYITGTDPFVPREVSGKIDWEMFQEPCRHKVPYDPWRYFAWRWFWDYAGGLVTDVGVHQIDVVHWLTGKTEPKSAVCNGGVYGLDYWETPDVVNAVWDYGTHAVAFVSNFTNGFEGGGLKIFGTKATMEVRSGHVYVWAEGQRDKPIHELAPEGGSHQRNWIDCIRTGKVPNAPVALGFSSLLPCHLANIAYRRGAKVTWDPGAKKIG